MEIRNQMRSSRAFPLAPVTLFSAAIVALMLASSVGTRTAGANTLVVGSGGFSSINEAIQAASPGDVVLVHTGVFHEQVEVDRSVTIQSFGDGMVWLDEECTREVGFHIIRSGASVRGIGVKKTMAAGVLIESPRPDIPPPANVTVDSMTIQDFDCIWQGQEPSGWGQYRAGVAAWYSGSGIRITNNAIRHRVEIPQQVQGSADGIWFKSSDANPSGGGHYIANNTIVGGWDGIGGEEEFSAHGTFDKDSTVENNVVSDCWDDGIQVEGGDQNVHVQFNRIDRCGSGIAFAAPVTGPLYVEQNYIGDLKLGLYGNLQCFKVGDPTTAVTYLTANICNSHATSSDPSQPGTDGIHQTNEGLGPIVSRGNQYNVNRYGVINNEGSAGQDWDTDCIYTTGTFGSLIKWAGVNYDQLTEFRAATGHEPNGVSSAACAISAPAPPSPPPVGHPPPAQSGPPSQSGVAPPPAQDGDNSSSSAGSQAPTSGGSSETTPQPAPGEGAVVIVKPTPAPGSNSSASSNSESGFPLWGVLVIAGAVIGLPSAGVLAWRRWIRPGIR